MDSFEALIPIVFFITFAAIIKILSDNRVRKMLIEKGRIDENLKYLYQNHAGENPLSSVKWGLVLIGLGLAFLLRLLFPEHMSDEALVGMMFLFSGIGFLSYYAIAKKQQQSQNHS